MLRSYSFNPPHRLQWLLRRRNAIGSARGGGTNRLGEDLFQRAPRGRILITALTSPGRRIESSRPVKKALHAFGFRSNGSHRFLLGLSETERERRQVRSTVTAVTRLLRSESSCPRQKLLNIQMKLRKRSDIGADQG